MNFCIIRLGKDSVSDIQKIDDAKDEFSAFKVSVICKQVPFEVNNGTYCLIWLGSDNNKGIPTNWEQGIRAFGKVLKKTGGPVYNDTWEVDVEIGFVLTKSIKKLEILSVNSKSYALSANIPVVGLNTSSNQTIQLIKPNELRQDISALFYCINAVDNNFYRYLDKYYPELGNYTIFNPPLDEDNVDFLYEEIESELIDTETETSIISKSFDPSLVNIDNRLVNIDLIVKRLRQQPPEIDLYPEFQRSDDLWDRTKQSRLIESILIRFPLPAFYFDGSDKNNWLVVDGLQRLSSIRNFMLTKTLKLTNLEFLAQLEGFGFDDLDRSLQRQIEETQIIAYVINPGTPDDVKFNIFKRINTGGLVLTAQEIRHALYQGKPSKFIAELSDLEQFKIATNYSIRSQRMLDRDFINRFLAFYLLGEQNYMPDLDTFMSRAMAQIYILPDTVLNKCKDSFINSMQLNSIIFESNAFRRIDRNSTRKKPLNKALFDVFSVLFARLDTPSYEKLKDCRKQFVHGFINLLEVDSLFQSSISSSTSDRNRVTYRFEKISELIESILGN
ncbi:DUF262 domain-containing protein [Mucilaginibacter galii]|uniref:GmrSD restriction endonucleases N-terminal domain-containing protein n=1 Tax=Mucilaginibacter galii TaxID=2005073 RepID=A0A917JC67_9SPHI|nr:DUF262 domain-containing protein [Mucilaginibacter galii]GGI52419.1 hypothetical protein GCM10011425_36310 [Mucilaginibacter galii]